MKRLVSIALVISLTFGMSSVAKAATSTSAITKLTVSANGANEKPNQGSKTGSASGTFVLNVKKNSICFVNMKSKGISEIIGAHIHLGATGIDGSIFASFDINQFNRRAQICLKANHLVLLDMIKNPADYYFNVHSAEFPSGAVRGQLKKST